MKIKHNGVEKEIAHTSQLPVLGLGTTHLFEPVGITPRIVFRVRTRTGIDGYDVSRDIFQIVDGEWQKDTHDYGVVATREGVWGIITMGVDFR